MHEAIANCISVVLLIVRFWAVCAVKNRMALHELIGAHPKNAHVKTKRNAAQLAIAGVRTMQNNITGE